MSLVSLFSEHDVELYKNSGISATVPFLLTPSIRVLTIPSNLS